MFYEICLHASRLAEALQAVGITQAQLHITLAEFNPLMEVVRSQGNDYPALDEKNAFCSLPVIVDYRR